MATQPWLVGKILKQSFRYTPLNGNKKEVRIIELAPGLPGEEVRCRLQTVSLLAYHWKELVLERYCDNENAQLYSTPYATDNDWAEAQRQHGVGQRTCESRVRAFRTRSRADIGDGETQLDVPSCGFVPCICFEALSYTWGSFTESRTIELNGQTGFSVSDNLFAALCRLRRLKKARRLWVDAICINQADLEERAAQVRLMATLYSSAPEVLIWLGDADIERVKQRVPLEFPHIFKDRSAEARQHKVRYQMLNLAIGEVKPAWFFRAWIVQEVVMAKHPPKVQLGAFEGVWLDLLRAFLRSPLLLAPGKAVRELDSMRSGRIEERSILDMLHETRLECTDLRDKIYSLLGMVRDSESSLIEVDYSEKSTLAKVYIQATYASIIGSANLGALAFVRPYHARTPGLPSWAVDFAYIMNFELGTMYNPVKWTAANPRVDAVVSIDHEILLARGLHLDNIRNVIPLTGAETHPAKDSGTFVLDQDCADKIKDALTQLPQKDPYSLLPHAARAVSANTSTAQTNLDWTDLIKSAECRLRSSKTELAIRFLRHTRDDLFAVWDKIVSLRQRCSVPDYRDPEVMDYTRGLNMGLDAQGTATQFAFFTTECGFLGIGLRTIGRGDSVALLYGSRLPAILHAEQNGKHSFRGLALVNGVSFGELCEAMPDCELPEWDYKIQ